MAFTVADLQDLLRLIDQHPEWRAELRRHVLSDELLELPGLVRQQAEHLASIAERMDQLTQRIDALTQRMDELAQRMDAITQRMDELTHRMDALAQRMDELTQRMDALVNQVSALVGRVGNLEGEVFELRYDRRAPSYFSKVARRLHVVEPAALADMLDDAVEQQGLRLTEDERDDLLRTDLVLTGRRREDSADVYVVAEVSLGVGLHDVERVVERAAILERLGRPVLKVVAGHWINPEADALAQAHKVWQVLDGRTKAPS
jgi:chromosome segregation ATPase